MKGAKRKPIELQVLRGNPGRRPLPKPIPVPDGLPDCPEHLSSDVKSEWKRLCELLQTMGIVSKVEVHAMEILCDTWIRFQRACKLVDQYGEVLNMSTETKSTGADGRTKEQKSIKLVVSPYFKVRKTLVAELHRLLVEFGLTPAARARIMYQGADKPEDDPLEAILKARAGMN